MTPEEALTKAADIITERGHTKDGRFMADDGSVCALGGLALACGVGEVVEYHPGLAITWGDGDSLFQQAGNLLAKHLNLYEHDLGYVPDWNDRSERSAEDVILAMKRAGHGEAT